MHWYDCQGKNKTGRREEGRGKEIWGRGMRFEWELNVKMFFTHVNAQQRSCPARECPSNQGKDDLTVPVSQPFSSAIPLLLVETECRYLLYPGLSSCHHSLNAQPINSGDQEWSNVAPFLRGISPAPCGGWLYEACFSMFSILFLMSKYIFKLWSCFHFSHCFF